MHLKQSLIVCENRLQNLIKELIDRGKIAKERKKLHISGFLAFLMIHDFVTFFIPARPSPQKHYNISNVIMQ